MTWCEICHGATGTTCTCPTEAPFDVATGEAPAAREMFVCAECGPRANADEDGCCTTCGADCVVAAAASPDRHDAARATTEAGVGAPVASLDGDWRLAEGAAPRREGDDTSPEEAIRLIRGHEPATSPEPVAWQFQTSRRGHDEPPRWHTCTRKTFEERRDQGLTTRTLYAEPTPNRQELHATRWSMLAAIVAKAKLDANHAGDSVHTEVFDEFLGMMAQVERDIPAPTPNSEAESALLEALEKIIAEVSERRVGHREKIAEIARTAINQARGD